MLGHALQLCRQKAAMKEGTKKAIDPSTVDVPPLGADEENIIWLYFI